MDPMVCLNEDNSFQIFSYFDREELAKCCEVSQKWYEFASQDRLWIRWLPKTTVLPKVNIKKYMNTCALISLNQLIQRTRELVDQLALNEVGVLTCFFPTNPKCKINMEFRYRGANFHSEVGGGDLKERVYVFVGTIQGNNEVNNIHENPFLRRSGLFPRLAPAFAFHCRGNIESRLNSILILHEVKEASKRGGFLQHRFEMIVSKDHPLYPRACSCTMELELF